MEIWPNEVCDTYSGLPISTEQLQCIFLVCKLTSSGPNVSSSTPNSQFTSLRTSPLTTSLHSEICDHLTTRDRGTTYKLKPRLFIKLYSAPTSFTCYWSLLLGFILSLSNIPLRHSTLLHSRVYFYLLLCTSILHNSVLNRIYRLTLVPVVFQL